jgi:hypothetical protein
MERFNVKKLNNMEFKEQIKISNGFKTLEILDDTLNLSKAWKSTTENI